jgi:hypothetical protein
MLEGKVCISDIICIALLTYEIFRQVHSDFDLFKVLTEVHADVETSDEASNDLETCRIPLRDGICRG